MVEYHPTNMMALRQYDGDWWLSFRNDAAYLDITGEPIFAVKWTKSAWVLSWSPYMQAIYPRLTSSWRYKTHPDLCRAAVSTYTRFARRGFYS